MFLNEKITILYGSQTGNSQDLAERIWRESKLYYFISSVQPMDDYNVIELINEKCVIFVCSTTGRGEEPDNMRTFWKFLLRKSLGDSGYSKFNFVAKRLHKRLLQLGAQSLLPVGLGDDQHDLGYDAVADPWIQSLWNILGTIYPLPSNIQPLERNSTILPRWNVTCSSPNHYVSKSQSIYYSTKKPEDFTLTVVDNIRTTDPSHFQDVRLLKFTSNDGHWYSPGDVLVLRPRNLPQMVTEFKDLLNSNGVDFSEQVMSLSQNDPCIPVPEVLKKGVPFQLLCEEYFDLMAVPRRYTFNILAQITDSELEKEKCLEFTTPEGQDDLYTYCNRAKRNIVEVLQDFPHATKNITKELLFEILPPIKPREFSIASSFKQHENEIHVLMSVVKYKTKLVKERLGLCSNYLADLKCGDTVLGSIKRGSFRFPTNNNTPVIMVGPGTGIAPFRSYISEKTQEEVASSENLLLFFGCRYENSDFHFKDEFYSLAKERKLTLITAFSREQDNKIYVQHRILENRESVWRALKNNGHIFVAGSAKFMPQEVRNAFLQVCQICGNMRAEEAEKFIESLEKQNRYQIECWC